ncbi:MAG: FAD-dependent oxidoreductase [Deinococcota bacterium]
MNDSKSKPAITQPSQHQHLMNQAQDTPRRGLGHRYDVMIVGAGVAGCEAAWRCQAAGLDTLLITTSLDTVYNLLGDAVRLEPPEGSLMQRIVDDVHEDGLVGNWAFHRRAKTLIEQQTDIHLLQSSVMALLYEDNYQDTQASLPEDLAAEQTSIKPKQIKGVRTWEGVDRFATQVALCVGSFLGARLTIGSLTEVAGRLSEMAYDDLFEDLKASGFNLEPTQLNADFQDGSLPYDVRCHMFSATEQDGYKLEHARGLYAAGVCRRGYIPFEEAALEGQQLARELIRHHQQS